MQKGFLTFSALFFWPHGGGNGVNVMTLNERKILARRWERGESAVVIAKEMGFSSATVYSELKRGADGTLDENKRLRYDPELGQEAYQKALRNRGRRPAAAKG